MQAMIPAPPGPGDLPTGPERPEPIRLSPPPATALWAEIDELQRTLTEFAERLEAIEDRLTRLEGRKH